MRPAYNNVALHVSCRRCQICIGIARTILEMSTSNSSGWRQNQRGKAQIIWKCADEGKWIYSAKDVFFLE